MYMHRIGAARRAKGSIQKAADKLVGDDARLVAGREAAQPYANRLLGLLSRKDRDRLRPHLHPVPLEYRLSLYRAHERIGFVYFLETGVGSLVNTMSNGQAAEVGTIGNEGMVGLPLVLGDDSAPTSVYVQVPGAGLRMTAALFRKELARGASMRAVRPGAHLV
jgi:CRP-like cAMP-binding protein